jgi:hypothetical protein
MQYHCRRPDRLLLVFASHQERFAILLLRSWTRFDSFVTRIDYTCSPVQFLLFPSQADGRASRGFLRRKVARNEEAAYSLSNLWPLRILLHFHKFA